MKIIKRIFVLIIALCTYTFGIAQSESTIQSATLPLDSSIRYGQLPNGFRYYIKSIDKPLSNLYLDLYVKAGINQENESQLNFAHAIEHLAFKTSKNFPLGIKDSLKHQNISIVDYSGSSGETTNYYFKVPRGNKAVLDIALLWFKDIATGLKLSEKDINQVRGELIEEFLLKAGDNLSESFATSSLEAKLFPGRKSNINFFEHHKRFESEKLYDFYRDWYRPDLMAISVVGNITDVDAMERRLKEWFANIQLSKNSKELPDSDAAYYKRPPQFAVVERKTDTTIVLVDKSITFQLFFRAQSIMEKIHTMEGIKRLIKLKLLINITNKRLTALTNGYNSFNAISIDRFSYSNLPPLLEVRLKMFSGEKQALQKTIRALHQLQEYGVLEQEWKEIKNNYLRELSSNYKDRTSYWINEIFNHFQYDEALPTQKQNYLKEWLSELTREDFNDYVFQFLSEMPKDIGVLAPTGHKALSLTEKEMRLWIQDAYKSPVIPYKLPEIPKVLMSNEKIANLKKNKYVDKGIGKSGARELLLTNGVKIILKPNDDISPSKIKLHGFSPNGALCFPNRNQSSAINASNVVRNTGVGKMDKFTLKRFLSNTSVRVTPYTGFMETGIVGNTAFEDIEKMFQLIYLYFTAPRKNKVAFNDWKLREQNAYLNPTYGLIPADFSNSIKKVTGNNYLSRGPVSFTRALMGTERFESTKNTDFDMAYKAYKKLYGNIKDFTFIITGDFTFDSIIPLTQKYLGNLPNVSKLSECTSSEVNSNPLPLGPIYKEILPFEYYTMKNVSYASRFISKAENPGDWKEQIKIDVLGKIIGNLGWNLRFNKGYNIYLITAFGKYNMDMQRYELGFNLSCSNEELALLREECKQIISKIRSGAITEHMFENSRNMLVKKRINEQKRLYEYYCYGQPWVDSAEIDRFIKSLTIKDIVEIANKYCKEEYLFEFVMKDKELGFYNY